MREAFKELPDTKLTLEAQAPARTLSPARPCPFKYYIHDSTDYFRIELVGHLTEAAVTDLVGCWCTAQSSVGSRKVILDVRSLKSVDTAARAWLDGMVRNGAEYATRKQQRSFTFSREWSPGEKTKSNVVRNRGWRRLLFRSVGRNKNIDEDVDAPWADCRS